MAGLFLFETGRFTPLVRDGKCFKATPNSGIDKPISPSSFWEKDHAANVTNLCRNYTGYILCPYYSYGDYQLLVTGKTIYKLDTSNEEGIIRKIIEETGVKPAHLSLTDDGYQVDISCGRLFNPKTPIYDDFELMTKKEFSLYEKKNREKTTRINAVVYGQFTDFKKIYTGKVKRVKFANADIIGFLLIPTSMVLEHLL